MAVQRWKFQAEGETYVVPMNPATMTSLFPTRNVTAKATTGGRVLMFEGNPAPAAWQFSGSILNKDHYEALRHWVYDIKQRVTITDHYGREIVCVLQVFEPTPKRALGKPWSHAYTVRAMIVSVGAPTVFDFPSNPDGTTDPGTGGTGGSTGGTPTTTTSSAQTYRFSAPSTTWVITHSLDHKPIVETVDSLGRVVFGSVAFPDDTHVVVTWSAPMSGSAILI